VVVAAVDRFDRRADEPRELEDRHTGVECFGREGVPQLRWSALPDPGGFERRAPIRLRQLLRLRLPPFSPGEQERRVQPCGQLVERLQGARRERCAGTGSFPYGASARRLVNWPSVGLTDDFCAPWWSVRRIRLTGG
jgi:hypothetical protein